MPASTRTGSTRTRELTVHIERPVNALAITGLSLAELAGLGVRRVSAGSLPYRAPTYPELQDRLAGHADRLRS